MLQELVLDVLLESPREIRSSLVASMVVCGGGAMMPGVPPHPLDAMMPGVPPHPLARRGLSLQRLDEDP